MYYEGCAADRFVVIACDETNLISLRQLDRQNAVDELWSRRRRQIRQETGGKGCPHHLTRGAWERLDLRRCPVHTRPPKLILWSDRNSTILAPPFASVMWNYPLRVLLARSNAAAKYVASAVFCRAERVHCTYLKPISSISQSLFVTELGLSFTHRSGQTVRLKALISDHCPLIFALWNNF